MSEPLEIGDALKAARQAKGWTVQDAAGKLRLMVRQVEAMETEDYAALGQPVFARGFVRNYARLLGIDPDPLLTKMAESGAAPAEKVEAETYPPVTTKGIPPVLVGALVVLTLLLAIPALIYLWLNSGAEEAQTEPAPPSTLVAPSNPAMVHEPMAEPAPQTVQPVTPAETPAPAATPEPLPAAAPKPAPAAEQAPPKPAPPPAPEAAAPDASANPYLPANFRHKSIRLQFDQDAWVQVRDGNGRTIHSALSKAGSSVELSGKPPFEFVVGNAANVRMTYSGRPFDIKPYIGETVARFTLE
jgi:cytoskeleton protein RodZ